MSKGSDLNPNVPQKVQLLPTKTSVRMFCSLPDGLPSASNLAEDAEISQASMDSSGVQSGVGRGVSLTVSGSIASREAGLLPPDQRFRYLWFKRALRCRRFESKIQSIYEKTLENWA